MNGSTGSPRSTGKTHQTNRAALNGLCDRNRKRCSSPSLTVSTRFFNSVRGQTNITLQSLDLSWNSVRMDSGVTLGQSLAHNGALVELKLAQNKLTDQGVQAVSCKRSEEFSILNSEWGESGELGESGAREDP